MCKVLSFVLKLYKKGSSMFKIDLSNVKRTTQKEINDIIHYPITPKTLTEVLDNFSHVAKAMSDNGVSTLEDLTTRLEVVSVRWNDQIAIYKAINTIITINNNPNINTDYGYLVNMLKIMREDYDSIAGDEHKSSMTINLQVEKINEPKKPIEDVLVTLFNVLGYEQAMIIISIFAGYEL